MLYPLKFQPIYKDKIWGGDNLKKFLNRPIPENSKIGESWEVSDQLKDNSIVLNGDLKGKTLGELLKTYQRDLIGLKPDAKYLKKFPLLIKYIDANDKLSVQVHPDDNYAMENENGESGKTEMWYIIHAEPGARLIAGLKNGIEKKDFKNYVEQGNIEDILHYIDVKTGDALYIPAGRVHAIMPGLVINEIQQNSDITYRVYDWDRVGFDGKPRDLHVEKSLAVINFNDFAPDVSKIRYSYGGTNIIADLVHCLFFQVEKYIINEQMKFHSDKRSFSIYSVIDGYGILNWENKEIELNQGDTILVPAAVTSYAIYPQPVLTVIRSYI